jgi:Caspase domain
MKYIPPGTTRAAVVIGVDLTNGLKKLKGAASGALDMGTWLHAEGYHVTAHTDAAKDSTVQLADIFKTVDTYARMPTMRKLVVYFAGHGYYSSGNEIWLLSGAPGNPNEAINLKTSGEFARLTRLTHVIFIADTCRSMPQDFAAQQIQGASIFPNIQSGGKCEIDTFFATLVGDPAAEVSVDEAMKDYKGLFTEALKDIHKQASDEDAMDADVDGSLAKVFPNRRLKKRLPDFFSDEAKRKKIKVRQTPSLRVESDEPVHLARATIANGPFSDGDKATVDPKPFSSGSLAASVETAARNLMKLNVIPEAPKSRSPDNDKTQIRLAAEAREQRHAEQSAHFETRSGALVFGTGIADALAIGGYGLDIENGGTGEVSLRFKTAPDDWGPLDKPFSAAIRFTEGTGTIIAALPGFVASLLVRDGGLINVSYVPAEGSPRWGEYQHFREELENRRAMAATAARHGVLALDRDDARAFGDNIRMGKSIDPTLGIYASLAYASVGLREDVKSVLSYMQGDTHANLFDAWLLAGASKDVLSDDRPLVPSCPMLSQTWDYLSPAGYELPAPIANAARIPSLWTTFAPQSMDEIFEAIRKGTLK